MLSLLGTGLATVALGLLAYDLAGANAGAVLYLANSRPFASSGSLRTSSYYYTVLLGGGPRRAPRVRQRYDVRDIRLQGRYRADGCCTCYENTAKTATLLTSAPGVNSPASGAIPVDLKEVLELWRP